MTAVIDDDLADADKQVEFAFAFDPPVARWSRLFGITPSSARVVVGTDVVDVCFGPWRLRTSVGNVASAVRTGPYRAWKVAGPARLSLSDRGITFATTAQAGVCIGFHQPVVGLDPIGLVRHPAMTVTVADPDGLLRALGHPLTFEAQGEERPRGSLWGALKALVSSQRRSGAVRSTPVAAGTLSVPSPAVQRRPEGQPIQSGVGDVFHRTYRTSIEGAELSAGEAMAAIQADPNLLADPELGPFVKDRGAPDAMAQGDRFTVELRGPWRGPIEVVDVSPHAFRLATLEGHMEAGLVEIRIEDKDTSMDFVVESWARSGDSYIDTLYDKVGVAKALQTEMWAVAGERFAAVAGGRIIAPMRIDEERAPAWPLVAGAEAAEP